MAISRPCYCSRTDVQRAPDFKNGYVDNIRVDRALASAADKIEGQLRRVFYPRDFTYRWDWPNYQSTYPWQLYLENWDICVLTDLESPQGTQHSAESGDPVPAEPETGLACAEDSAGPVQQRGVGVRVEPAGGDLGDGDVGVLCRPGPGRNAHRRDHHHHGNHVHRVRRVAGRAG